MGKMCDKKFGDVVQKNRNECCEYWIMNFFFSSRHLNGIGQSKAKKSLSYIPFKLVGFKFPLKTAFLLLSKNKKNLRTLKSFMRVRREVRIRYVRIW